MERRYYVIYDFADQPVNRPYYDCDEVDRELVRLRAEVRRLKALIDDAGKPWIRLDPGIPWEGAIDAAMAAACAEIERLRANAEADNSHAMSTAADNEKLAARIAELEADVVFVSKRITRWDADGFVCKVKNNPLSQWDERFVAHDGTDASLLSAVRRAREGTE